MACRTASWWRAPPRRFDGKRLLADTRKICEAAMRLWHGEGKPPFKNYLFMLNVVHDGYGGLEHRNSTALICARRDLPAQHRACGGRGLHHPARPHQPRYFHAWNVKRLRPAEFARYDYAQENYTQLLWFFEGFTSYYDDLLLPGRAHRPCQLPQTADQNHPAGAADTGPHAADRGPGQL